MLLAQVPYQHSLLSRFSILPKTLLGTGFLSGLVSSYDHKLHIKKHRQIQDITDVGVYFGLGEVSTAVDVHLFELINSEVPLFITIMPRQFVLIWFCWFGVGFNGDWGRYSGWFKTFLLGLGGGFELGKFFSNLVSWFNVWLKLCKLLAFCFDSSITNLLI